MKLARETARVQPVDRPGSRRRDGRDQRQPPGRVGRGNAGRAGGQNAGRAVTNDDGLALDGHRFRAADGTYRHPVPGLPDARRLDAEPQVAASGQELPGPVRDEFVLRVDVATAPAAQPGIVQHEGLPVGAELDHANPPATPDDRVG